MLHITTLTVTPLFQNTRVLADTDSGTAVVVDPGGEIPKVLQLLSDHSFACKEIWLTHSHLDHCGGVAALLHATGARLLAHPAERQLRATVAEVAADLGLADCGFEDCPEPNQDLTGGELLSVGIYQFKVRATPGHTPGHLAFWCESEALVISGDTIFKGTIGRSDLDGGSEATLLQSAVQGLLSLPGETAILCGHGPDTTVLEERRNNPYFRERCAA